MASVKIISGLYGHEEAATVPRAQWPELVRTRSSHCHVHFRQDCRALMFFVEDAAKNDWLGFGSREKYIADGLGLDLKLVPWAIEGLKRIDPDRPIPFNEAVVLGRQGAPMGNDNAAKVRKKNKPRNTKFDSDTAEYRLARLRRDQPELAERVERGELTANAAAIEAGFRRKTFAIDAADPSRAAATILKARGSKYAAQLAGYLTELAVDAGERVTHRSLVLRLSQESQP